MVRKLMMALLSVLLLAMTATVSMAQQALELNTPINARYVDAPVVFTINAEQDQTVLIVVTSDAADLAIEVYDATNTYIAGDSDSGDGVNPALGISFPRAGQYRVLVLSYDGEMHNADFTILMQPLEIVTEAEIVLGEIVRGVVGDTFPTFTFTVERETTLLISPLTYNFPAQLTLSTEGGEFIAGTSGNFLKQVVPAGRYQLLLNAAFEGYAPRPYYALLVTEAVIEPLTRGDVQTVNAVGERARFYTFEAQAGEVVDVVVNWTNGFGAGVFFSLLSPTGEPLYFSESTTNTTFISGAMLPVEGTYSLEVLPFSLTFRSPFTLLLADGAIIEVSATPTTILIDANVTTRQLSAQVIEGRTYRLTVTTDNPARPFSVFLGSDATLSVVGGRGGSIEFTNTSASPLSISLRSDSTFYGDPEITAQLDDANLTITFEEVNQ